MAELLYANLVTNSVNLNKLAALTFSLLVLHAKEVPPETILQGYHWATSEMIVFGLKKRKQVRVFSHNTRMTVVAVRSFSSAVEIGLALWDFTRIQLEQTESCN